jgi:Cu/Ag efflux pump CusA
VQARWTIAPTLVGVEGVANVSVWGFRDRQLQVQVDPEKLRDQKVSLVQIVESAGNALWFSPLTFVEANTPGTGGFIDTPNQRLGIQHHSPITSAADLAKVSIEDTGSRRLVLGDVASVVEDHQPLIGDALVNNANGDLLFVVEKLPEANTLEVTRNLEAAIGGLAPGLPGIEFDTTVYRPASFIDTVIENMRLAVILGAALIALILGAFFLRFRTALIAFSVLPISLVAAALVLWALGTTMNAIILVGLIAALVFVIDDAVIGTDNIERRLREHRRERKNGSSTVAVIFDATLETRGATAYATLVIALALAPVFLMNGLAGSFFPDMAGAFLLALLASMLVGLTVTPALAVLLVSQASLERTSPLAGWVQRGYERALSWIVSRSRWAYIAAGAVVVATCACVPFLSSSLLPTFKEEQLLIRWDGPAGTSLPEMNRITALASNELRSVPGVRDVGAHVGRAIASDSSANANTAELWVSIDPSAEYDETVASIREVVNGYPGLSRSVEAFSNERATEVLGGTEQRDIVARLYGEEPQVLQTQAERVKQTMASVDGIADASIELPAVEPTVEVEVDLASARAAGIKPGDVRRAAATLLAGLTVGNLFEEQKVFEVVVKGTPETRNSLTSIRNLLVETPDGRHVRLDQVADVRIAADPAVINRQAVSRYLDIGASVSGRDRGDVVRDVREQLEAMQFPLEYHTELLAADGQPTGRLIGLGIAAAVGIFLLLQAAFGSWRLATLCFVAFPLAVSGGVLMAALADGGTLSFGSWIALFAVFGLAVRNGMLLIERFRRLELHGEASGAELVVRGAAERVVPTLTTALAAGLALTPFVIRGGIAGYELAHPLALVVVGGLVTSTLLSLFVLPVVYLQFGGSAAQEPAVERDLVSDLKPYAETPAAPAGVAMQDAPVHLDPSA